MRLQIDPRLIGLMRHPNHPNLRFYIFTLYDDQEPDWAIPLHGLPNHYTFDIDGLTMLYYVSRKVRLEPFTRVALVESVFESDNDS